MTARLTLLLLLPLLLGFIPAELGRRKGRSFAGFWLFGVCFLPFAIAVALLSSDRRH
jgi:hypothetical protein